MKKPKKLLWLVVPVLLLAFVLIFKTNKEKDVILTTTVKRGKFEVKVFSSGQIESGNQLNIPVPDKLNDRRLRIWSLKITELVEEGTYVDSGGFVARLDPEAVQEQIKSAQDDLDKASTEYEDARIDSNLNLSNQRDEITNAILDRDEKEIIVKESIYESPSVQKKAQMDCDKAQRKYEQEKEAYTLKKKQEENKVNRQFINFRQLRERLDGLNELYKSLVITAPKSGIITYIKNPWGITKVGSEVSGSDAVATIPEMTNLISRTYINEIDISKVKEGQKVDIGIDAFPNKKMTGKVVSIANIGQSMPNSDAKVFEVKIKIFGADKDLKPAMTTNNIIYAGTYPDTLFIPSDAVFENDSLQYVYLSKDGLYRQVVRLGEENENFVIAKEGLHDGDLLYLNEPEDASDLPWRGLDIYRKIKKEKEEKKKAMAREIAVQQSKTEPGHPSGGDLAGPLNN